MRFVAFFMSRSILCKVTIFFWIDKLFLFFFLMIYAYCFGKCCPVVFYGHRFFLFLNTFFGGIVHSIDARTIDFGKSRIIRKKIVYLHIYYIE